MQKNAPEDHIQQQIRSEGIIVSRHQVERMGHTYLVFWLLTENGPVRLVSEPQSSVFFVRRNDEPAVRACLQRECVLFTVKPLNLKTFEQTPVTGVYFARSSAAYAARRYLNQEGIETFEDDIRLTERFLMERFVYSNALTMGTPLPSSHRLCVPADKCPYPQLQLLSMRPGENQPELRVVSLDIECDEHGNLYSIGLYAADLQRVLMIGEEQHDEQKDSSWIRWVADEPALLRAFVEEVRHYDPDIFIGWNVINFDFSVLLKASKRLSVPLEIGRDGSELTWRDASGDANNGFVTIPGRIVLDGIDGLKTATHQFESFSLEYVAQALLGKGKDSDDVDNRLDAIKHDFEHDKLKLARYNLMDCQLVMEIFNKTHLLDFLLLRSQLTGLELDRQGGSVAAFLNLYLPKLHRAGYVSPNRPGDGGLASPGGYVMDSRPGLYEHVLVLDFKSLYPSIIRTFKIDPMGLHEGLLKPEQAIPGFKGAMFSREQHFLPDIITSLWQQRDQAKRQQDSARSQAIKILMNSFYGVLGSGGCPFYDTRLASSITMRGHEIMQTTKAWIEEAGFDVIYGDTDSTFVWLNGQFSDEDAQRIGKQLADDINKRWQDKLEQEFTLPCYLEIEFETHFRHFLMPTIRGADTGSKKRYAGVRRGLTSDELVFKGLESVRSDWTAMAQHFQRTLYQMVFNQEPVDDYIRRIVAEVRQGTHDELLTYKKRLRRALSQYTKNVPPHVKAARLADEHNQQLGKPLQYQRKGMIEYVITLAGAQPVEYQTSPLDYDHYIEKQIQPVAEGILPFINRSFEQIVNQQISLF